MGDHPLTALMRRVGAGDFPPADGAVEVMPSPPGRLCGVLAFTAHHIVAADVDPAWVRARLIPGDFISPMGPRFLAALAEETGAIPGVLDAVLCASARRGKPELPLTELPPDVDHPRVAHARLLRADLRVYGAADGAGVLVIGRGLAGRWEASFEVAEPQRGRGLGRALAAAALTLVPRGEALFMQVSPGERRLAPRRTGRPPPARGQRDALPPPGRAPVWAHPPQLAAPCYNRQRHAHRPPPLRLPRRPSLLSF